MKTIRNLRAYTALLMLLIFSCYYSGISLFSHVHIVNGASVIHSHWDGGSAHEHSDNQYAVIDLLSNFQSEGAVAFNSVATPLPVQLSDSFANYTAPLYKDAALSLSTLRGPPSYTLGEFRSF